MLYNILHFMHFRYTKIYSPSTTDKAITVNIIERDVNFNQNNDIRITKRTVSFSSHVYQLCNITGFSSGVVKTKPMIPWNMVGYGIIISIALFIMNTTLYSNFSHGKFTSITTVHVSYIMMLILSILIIVNIFRAKKYGLLVTLNSGNHHLFVTSAYSYVGDIVDTIYEFIESGQDGAYIVHVTDNSITIQGNATGVVASAVGDDTSIVSEVSTGKN